MSAVGSARRARSADVVVTIKLDNAALVERIFGTARLVEGADWSGCHPGPPARHATGDLRPAEPWDVADGGAVRVARSVATCSRMGSRLKKLPRRTLRQRCPARAA